jgi:hypothetical protein
LICFTEYSLIQVCLRASCCRGLEWVLFHALVAPIVLSFVFPLPLVWLCRLKASVFLREKVFWLILFTFELNFQEIDPNGENDDFRYLMKCWSYNLQFIVHFLPSAKEVPYLAHFSISNNYWSNVFLLLQVSSNHGLLCCTFILLLQDLL